MAGHLGQVVVHLLRVLFIEGEYRPRALIVDISGDYMGGNCSDRALSMNLPINLIAYGYDAAPTGSGLVLPFRILKSGWSGI